MAAAVVGFTLEESFPALKSNSNANDSNLPDSSFGKSGSIELGKWYNSVGFDTGQKYIIVPIVIPMVK